MVAMYPLCAFRNNPVAASIDTPLHGFLPFPHVDHLHPDWGIALAASANGKTRWRNSIANSVTRWCGFPGSGPALSWA